MYCQPNNYKPLHNMISGIYSIWSDTVFNPIWCCRFQRSHPIVFSVFRTSSVSFFVDECYCKILKETIMAITIKMFIWMLYARFCSLKLSVIRFIIILSESKVICGFSSILFSTCFTCKQITLVLVITNQPMVNFKCFRGYTTSKSIWIFNIFTNLELFFITFPRTYSSF